MKDLALLNTIVDTYFNEHPDVDKIPVKDLMPQFVRARIFDKDAKKGLPMRRLLRALDRSNELHLIPSLITERNEADTAWFFGRNTAAASGDTPAASGDTPAASGDTPAASGDTPA